MWITRWKRKRDENRWADTLRILRLMPGDLVLITFPYMPSQELVARLQKEFSETHDDVKVAAFDRSVSIKVIRSWKAQESE